MTVSIARTKIFALDGHPEVLITYRVPTAQDFEKIVTNKPGDCELFKEFVTTVEGVTDETGTPCKAADIVLLPGSWPIVTGVAKAVIESATLGLDGKNE
jgi:hypothetical protein